MEGQTKAWFNLVWQWKVNNNENNNSINNYFCVITFPVIQHLLYLPHLKPHFDFVHVFSVFLLRSHDLSFFSVRLAFVPFSHLPHTHSLSFHLHLSSSFSLSLCFSSLSSKHTHISLYLSCSWCFRGPAHQRSQSAANPLLSTEMLWCKTHRKTKSIQFKFTQGYIQMLRIWVFL